MVRVLDVGRCCSSNKQAVSLAGNRVPSTRGGINISSLMPSFFHPRGPSANRIFSVVKLCDERNPGGSFHGN
jgi:hypothetical protein